jgi:hypothetical protein
MPASEKPLHIAIPVKLSDVNVVFRIGSLSFEGERPCCLDLSCPAERELHHRMERQVKPVFDSSVTSTRD